MKNFLICDNNEVSYVQFYKNEKKNKHNPPPQNKIK